MRILRKIDVPTGAILIGEGYNGKPLEFLSLGDYGQEKNIKADFLGLTREINGVPHGGLLPLTEKWVITISTQYGCSQGCRFCDVPKVGPGINASAGDMVNQVHAVLALHPEVRKTKRLNLHYARMGEPTFNRNVIKSAYRLFNEFSSSGFAGFHPVVSTMMPKHNRNLQLFLLEWLAFKDHLKGNAGLQISINTTDDGVRTEMMPRTLPLEEIALMLRGFKPLGRKIALNIALTDAPVNPARMRFLFDPKYFMVKITPMHRTDSCEKNGLLTEGGYSSYQPYRAVEDGLKKEGFDVIVFIPSQEEDAGRITCGNAILSGTEPSRKEGR